MAIDLETLKRERETLQRDYDNLNYKISETEKGLSRMKNNINAIFGAIQQVDRFMKAETSQVNQVEQQFLTEDPNVSTTEVQTNTTEHVLKEVWRKIVKKLF